MSPDVSHQSIYVSEPILSALEHAQNLILFNELLKAIQHEVIRTYTDPLFTVGLFSVESSDIIHYALNAPLI